MHNEAFTPAFILDNESVKKNAPPTARLHLLAAWFS